MEDAGPYRRAFLFPVSHGVSFFPPRFTPPEGRLLMMRILYFIFERKMKQVEWAHLFLDIFIRKQISVSVVVVVVFSLSPSFILEA
jgi:hypothetical protein